MALNTNENPNHSPGASQAEGARRARVRLRRPGRAPDLRRAARQVRHARLPQHHQELAQLRVELGGWLLREGYEPGGAAPADFRNELIDSLPPTECDALMGGGGGGRRRRRRRRQRRFRRLRRRLAARARRDARCLAAPTPPLVRRLCRPPPPAVREEPGVVHLHLHLLHLAPRVQRAGVRVVGRGVSPREELVRPNSGHRERGRLTVSEGRT